MAYRLSLSGLLLAFVFSWISGCGGPESVSEPPRVAAPPEEEPISQVGQGGDARLVLPAALRPACMNPYLPECRGAETLTGMVLEAPLALGPSMEYRPLLAGSIPAYADGTLALEPLTIEVRLRAGTNFADGEPLTSADVEWTYEAAARLARNGDISPLYYGFGGLDRVETPDSRTARLIFDEPRADWRDLLTAPILPRHVYEGRDLAGLRLNNEPVGSGPFLLKRGDEDRLRFVETPRYRVKEPPLPNLESVGIQFSQPDETAAALSEGRADFGFLPSPPDGPVSGNLLRASSSAGRVELLVFNSNRVEDRDLRRALAGEVDRESLAGDAAGDAPVAESFLSPGSPGHAPFWDHYGKGRGSIPSKAADNERPLDLVYSGDAGPAFDRAARALASDLSRAGRRVEARPVSPEDFHGRVLPEGDFDLALLTVDAPQEVQALSRLLPSRSAAALEESMRTLDEEDQAFKLAETERLMAGEAALLPLFEWPDTYAWSSTLSGPRPGTPYRGLAWNMREWGFYK